MDNLRAELAALVAERTRSSRDAAWDDDPREGLRVFAAACARRGGRVTWVDNPGRPRKPALVCDFGHGDPVAQLAGHLDTVPAAHGFSGDPWLLREHGNRWIGLGAADMKGFYAAALSALDALAGTSLRGLRLIATSDEESGMDGARALAAAGWLAPVPTVLGEPTGGIVAGANKGVQAVRVCFHGRDGHASRAPRTGVAMHALRELLVGLDAWSRQLAGAYRDDRFDPAVPTVNVGRVAGGDAFNRIATPVAADVEVRLLPGMAPETMTAELTDLAQRAAATAAVRVDVTLLSQSPPYAAREGPARTMPYTTEAGLFPDSGAHVVLWGPGELEQAHAADESVDGPALLGYREALAAWLRAHCV